MASPIERPTSKLRRRITLAAGLGVAFLGVIGYLSHTVVSSVFACGAIAPVGRQVDPAPVGEGVHIAEQP